MVRFIFTIIGLMISLDLVWWIVFARLTNHGVARVLVSIFMIAMMLGLIGVIAARMSRSGWERFIPKFAVTAIVIWHSIGLGLLSLIALALIPILLGKKMVRMVNEMRADLVLLTGDLINDALADLDTGLELARAMEARFGLAIIEGNHDLIENPTEFEARVKASRIPFLLDESTVVTVRGVPVQLLGLSWTRIYGKGRDAAIATSVQRLLEQRVADAFPILMAHHPHAFDAAASAGLPLTLSGHTHGGQLMLNEQLGFGPALFRYWSGLYERDQSKLIVSNGVGNWFPLRVNAPAEIVHLTLRRE